jgi:hypothetical protein
VSAHRLTAPQAAEALTIARDVSATSTVDTAQVYLLARALREAVADRDHLKRREQDIIDACERVADGGQYRADIVAAIQTIRRQRDSGRAWALRWKRAAKEARRDANMWIEIKRGKDREIRDLTADVADARRQRDEAIRIGLEACDGWDDQAAMPTDGHGKVREALWALGRQS